jgi:hypothetical protein
MQQFLSQNLYSFTNISAAKTTEIETESEARNAGHILHSNWTKLFPKSFTINTYDLLLASRTIKVQSLHCKSIIHHVPNYTGTFKVKCKKTDKRHDLTEFNCKSFQFCTPLLKCKFSKSTHLFLRTLHHECMQKPNYWCLTACQLPVLLQISSSTTSLFTSCMCIMDQR